MNGLIICRTPLFLPSPHAVHVEWYHVLRVAPPRRNTSRAGEFLPDGQLSSDHRQNQDPGRMGGITNGKCHCRSIRPFHPSLAPTLETSWPGTFRSSGLQNNVRRSAEEGRFLRQAAREWPEPANSVQLFRLIGMPPAMKTDHSIFFRSFYLRKRR